MAQKQLSKQRAKFVEEMVNPQTKTRTEAYQKAYGCSYDAARANAPKLLANISILAEIERRKAAIAAKHKITPESVTGGIVEIALDGENGSVRLGAFKTLGTYIGMEQAPRTNGADRTDIQLLVALRIIKRLIDEHEMTFEQAVGEYFGFIRPDHANLRERVTVEMLETGE
jgi:hypothetical protein